jgi:hypothetical protein
MQSETALRFPALAMQLSNVVKTFVLRAVNVLATPTTRAATPIPFPGRAADGATYGWADPGS